MRRVLLLVASAGLLATSAGAQTAPSAECISLSVDYDSVSKNIAEIKASGAGDDSAPRESNRQMRISNELATGSHILTIMVQKKCPMPKPVNPGAYGMAATKCLIDRMQAPDIEAKSCAKSEWQRSPGF